MNRPLQILTALLLTQAFYSCGGKSLKHEIGSNVDNCYLLTSVKTIQIDGQTLPCTIQATYHPDDKKVFLISIQAKDERLDTTVAYGTQFNYDEVRLIFACDHTLKRNSVLYKFENDILTDSINAGFKIYDLKRFIKMQKELKQKIESQIQLD